MNRLYCLKDYKKDGKVLEGFKLAERIIVKDIKKSKHIIKSSGKGSRDINIGLDSDSVYAQIDLLLKAKPIWKLLEYKNTDTEKIRTELFLENIKEYKKEADSLNLKGILIFINGIEPGKGTISLEDYKVKKGDIIEIVYKNEKARY